MPQLKMFLAGCCLCLAAAGGYAQTPVPAPPATQALAPSPEAQLLRVLIDEVRQLRATLQRINVNTYRAHSLNDRLAQQQSRVDSLTEEIEQTKALLTQALDTSEDETELKEMEAAWQETTNPAKREELLLAYQSFKRSLARKREAGRHEAERQRERQQQLEMTLRLEQAKLAEVQEQLAALNAEFEKQLNEPKKSR